MACDRCGHELQVGDFPFCKGRASDHAPGRFGVIPDEIPGGMEIKHGLCNDDGSPRKYYSKSEMAAEAKRRGMLNYVVHQGSKGSDKSKHTVRWV
jgi:hypothetical protein